ncbi:hypothetical protein ALP55_03899 [Pseudomonas coronafaciens pv. oryzae]|nr:hypothetical protein ALP55_03899 [Pseudomonas coronafaciens pv. oryzae]
MQADISHYVMPDYLSGSRTGLWEYCPKCAGAIALECLNELFVVSEVPEVEAGISLVLDVDHCVEMGGVQLCKTHTCLLA